MTQTKLLVITSDNHMSTTQRAEFTTRVQAIANKVGAELLVLEPGQRADLIDVCVIAGKSTPGEIRAALRVAGKSDIPAFVPSVHGGRGENGPELQVTGLPKVFSAESLASLVLGKPRTEVASVSAIQGEAMSFALDPLEQAIESSVRMLRDEHQQMEEVGAKKDTALSDRLGSPLDALLAIQLERVTADE